MRVLLLVLAVLVVAASVTAAEKEVPYSRLPPYSPELVARLLDSHGSDYDPQLACRILDKAAFKEHAAAFQLYQMLYAGAHGIKTKPELADYWLVQASNAMYPPAMKEMGRRLLFGEGMAPGQYLAYELLNAARVAGEDVGNLLDTAKEGLPTYFLDAIEADGGKSVTTFAYFDSPRRLSQPVCEISS